METTAQSDDMFDDDASEQDEDEDRRTSEAIGQIVNSKLDSDDEEEALADTADDDFDKDYAPPKGKLKLCFSARQWLLDPQSK